MPANRYMVDSGGTTRHIKKRYVIDSGGVARLIKKRYIVDAGGTTRLTFLYGNYFTMTAGAPGAVGYSGIPPTTYGSISPSATLNDGKILYTLNSLGSGVYAYNLFIGGFSSDPGQIYVTSIQTNGFTLLGAAATYQYTSSHGIQVATWAWNSVTAPFTNGVSYPSVLITT